MRSFRRAKPSCNAGEFARDARKELAKQRRKKEQISRGAVGRIPLPGLGADPQSVFPRRAKPSNEAREFARQRAQRASGVAEERNEKISGMDKRSVLEGGF